MRRQLNVRVSEYTRKQLTALCAATGLNEAGVITLALDRLAQDVRRIADALDRQVTEENLAESVRIWG